MVALDETDLEILRLLNADGRRAYSDIGESVGLSGPAVSGRIDRLREHGIIRGFTVTVDRSRVVGGSALLIEVNPPLERTETVVDALVDVDGTERVLTTAEGTVMALVRVHEGRVRDWIENSLPDPVPDYTVRIVEGDTRSEHLPVVGFDMECAECGNTVTAEGTTAQIGEERHHFCCPSCEERFLERYEDIAAGA